MKKSSACGNSNSCVWVGLTPGGTAPVVRVSDDEHAGVAETLFFTRAEWDAFVAGVKAGEFDYDRLTQDLQHTPTKEKPEA